MKDRKVERNYEKYKANDRNFPENNLEMWTLMSAANWTVIIKCKNLAVYLRLTGPVSNSREKLRAEAMISSEMASSWQISEDRVQLSTLKLYSLFLFFLPSKTHLKSHSIYYPRFEI